MSRESHKSSPQKPRARAGFTLVEILIVVVILGLLAAIVLPKFSNASHQARENILKDDLRFLRAQIQVFRVQHRDVPPGYPGGSMSASPTDADFVAQMTTYTDELCATNATQTPAYKFGPYLSKMPENPLNKLDTILVVGNGGAIPVVDDSTGWIYKPETQQIIANSTGADSSGKNYADY